MNLRNKDMSCIKDHLIQKYIDGEATFKEVLFIKDHITHCERCAAKIEHQRELSNWVKREINLLSVPQTQIPEFVIVRGPRKHFISTGRFVYSAAAACLLLFILVFFNTREEEKINEVTMISDYASDVDANRPVSQQELSIYIIDQHGNYAEYFVQ